MYTNNIKNKHTREENKQQQNLLILPCLKFLYFGLEVEYRLSVSHNSDML